MTILTLSDLHLGSIYGLLPPRFVRSDGSLAMLNSGQQWLWRQWQKVAKEAAVFRPDVLVVNGDVVDGCQRAQHGTELCLPVLEDQAAAAVEALQYMIGVTGVKRVYGVQGTEYHEGKAAHVAERVYDRIGAVRYAGAGSGRYSREVLELRHGRACINFAHHVGTGRVATLDREALMALDAGADATAVVRSHVHRYMLVEDRHRKVLVTPCWQLQTRFMRKLSVYRMWPDVGAVLLIPDAGSGEVVVKRWLFRPPALPQVEL